VADLIRRAIELSVDTLKLTGHRIAFEVEKSTKREPNQCDVTIYNLREDQRKLLTDSKEPIVRLAAGYEHEGLNQLFVGKAFHVVHMRKDADILTVVGTSDGGAELARQRINMSFDANTKIDTVLKSIVKALGLKEGNLNSVVTKLRSSRAADIYLQGTTVRGSCANELDHLCRNAGLQWSVQDGALQFVDLNQAADKFAIRLTPETGLLDGCSINQKGVVSGQCLMINGIKPGRQVEIDSEFVKGRYVFAKTVFRGDTEADDWMCEFEATKDGSMPKKK
jgi:hypothetical protein